MVKIIPESETEEIHQNIKTILSTIKGTVPLMRDFGIDPNLIDQPQNQAFLQILKNEIVAQIRKYEPRAKVKEIKLYEKDEKLYIWLKWFDKRGDYHETRSILSA